MEADSDIIDAFSINFTLPEVGSDKTYAINEDNVKKLFENVEKDSFALDSKSITDSKKSRWKNGVPPSYWVDGKYICEVCDIDCGYQNNLASHRKRKHGLKTKKMNPTDAKKSRWRNGVPPSYWVDGNYICEVCDIDCGYRNNLASHRKRKHGLKTKKTPKILLKKEFEMKMERNRALFKDSEDSPRDSCNSDAKSLADEYSMSLEEHPDDNNDLSINNGSEKKYVCNECVDCTKPDCLSTKVCQDKKSDSDGASSLKEIQSSNKAGVSDSHTREEDKYKPAEVVHEYLNRFSNKGSNSDHPILGEQRRPDSLVTRWRRGAPPSYWTWGRYVCEVCGKDCGYANNLNTHRKRKHGLHSSSKPKVHREKRKLRNPRERDTDGIIKDIVKTLGGNERTEQRAMPCGQCSACASKDCLACKWCDDKTKYGGPGRLNKRCKHRRCVTPVVTTHLRSAVTEGGRQSYVASGGLVKYMPCQQCDNCRLVLVSTTYKYDKFNF